MKAENLFGPGQRFWVESLRGLHFTVLKVHEDEVDMVDQNSNKWQVEVGDTLAIYSTDGPGPGVHGVPITEVHFK